MAPSPHEKLIVKKRDTVVVEDKNGRRQFIRTGAAFLLAASTGASSQEEGEFRSDCDSQGGVTSKNPEAEGSDSDSGNTADRPGCGRKLPLTEYKKEGHKKIKVGKVIA